MTKSYLQIVKQIEVLKIEAEKLRKQEVDGVVKRIREAIEHYGLTAADLATQAQANGGKVELTTVEGDTLTVNVNPDGSVTLTDEKGGTSRVTQADVLQSNGVVHVIDTVVMPN